MLRVVGASRGLLFSLVALEGAALGAAAGVLGVALGRGVLLLVSYWGRDTSQLSSLSLPPLGATEAVAVLVAWVIALLASVPAAWLASRLNPAQELAKR